MIRDKNSRILRTPPGYRRSLGDPIVFEPDLDEIGTGQQESFDVANLAKEYINVRLTRGKPHLVKHFEVKN